jgi:hypothetical protein
MSVPLTAKVMAGEPPQIRYQQLKEFGFGGFVLLAPLLQQIRDLVPALVHDAPRANDLIIAEGPHNFPKKI